MAVLVDIDASIGESSTISSGLEEEFGKAPPREKMQVRGADTVFTLANLKAHYDAIGSYLHMPSLEQLQTRKIPDITKLRERCEKVVGLVEAVLSSPVWNCTLGVFATLAQCMNEDCKKPVRKRIPVGRESLEVQCFECKAEYILTAQPDGRVLWQPRQTLAPCSTPDCPEKMALWAHEIMPGAHWHCRGCGAHNGITLSVAKIEDETDEF